MTHKLQNKPMALDYNIAIVTSRFNEPVTEKLYAGAIERLKELNFPETNITSVWVPGAVEIPLTAKRLAQTNRFKAIITLGAVIRGETTHYDTVCEQVSQGTQRVSFDYDLPVIFGILTTENSEQAFDRLGGSHGHKGRDCADTAIEMVSILQQVE